MKPIESHLHEKLVEHLNAEITLKTISDIPTALSWLEYSYYYQRVQRDPQRCVRTDSP